MTIVRDVTCPHCDGTGLCYLPRCGTCSLRQLITNSDQCGRCCGLGDVPMEVGI